MIKESLDTIVTIVFGSHLYGTDTPASDRDYKGVYLPSYEECYLNKIRKSINRSTKLGDFKNTKEDVDEEIYSLQYFMKLGMNGEMIIIDMLHCPDKLILTESERWSLLIENKDMFYSKNLAGYLGYIRKQCAKYSVKGSRLNAIEDVLKVLHTYSSDLRVQDALAELPINDYCRFVDNPKEKRFKMYECCGKQFQETVSIGYAIEILQRFYDRYGQRALMAKKNEGIDWKAVSHAFRAGFQLREIYSTGDLKYPLKDAPFIRDMKLGKFHYADDKIGEQMEEMLSEVEALALKSDFPEKVDVERLNKFIMRCYA